MRIISEDTFRNSCPRSNQHLQSCKWWDY